MAHPSAECAEFENPHGANLADTRSRDAHPLPGSPPAPEMPIHPRDPHPLQVAFYEQYGAQCGYCTPGMIMSSAALLKDNPHPEREDVVNAIVGNVCRCTGYHKIVASVLAAADEMSKE